MTKIFSVIVLCLLLVFTSACSIRTNTTNKDIQSKINEVWDEEIYFPKHEKHPIGIIYAEHKPILKDGKKVPDGEEPWMINIMYFSKDKESLSGNEHIDDWRENDALKKFIYEDNYSNQFMVGLTIQKRKIESIHPGNIEKEIGGHKVLYYMGPVRDMGDHVFIGINFDHLDYGYSMMYRIDNNNSENDAIAFAKDIIEKNKQKNN